MDSLPDYAELHCLSCFSFLRGASHPEELVQRALAQGYRALALTDECSLAGVVRAWRAARQTTLQLIIGSEIRLACGTKLVFLACNLAGYGNLSSLITLARRRSGKGEYHLSRGDLESLSPQGALPDCRVLWCPESPAAQTAGAVETAALLAQPLIETGRWLATRFPGRAWLAVELHGSSDDAGRLDALLQLAARCGLPALAAGDVHMHVRARRPLQDTLTALRLNTTVAAAGQALFANGERHLRSRLRLARCYPAALLQETLVLAGQCHFQLDEIRYDYPDAGVPPGLSPTAYLRQEVMQGLDARYPQGPPTAVRQQATAELELIRELGYEAYFLTVHDIVRFARQRGILCQGRGSAANSVVCFALGITEVDPAHSSLLFERFISRERGEPPDIDVDFEHQRREEVIQYLYEKYGRDRAALAAALITYRTRGALRDVGRALGFDRAQIDSLARNLAWWDKGETLEARLREVGLDPDSPRVRQWLHLARELKGFPRHLSQHVGGFVISRSPLTRLVPIENAAMPGRSVIQWDKDDLDALGLMKVDVLALGMLTALGRMLDALAVRLGRTSRLRLADLPREDPAVYAMLSRADSVGVFQVESRAQMAMLPRLRPRCFYDLVVQVAIVRPGPIQGQMVHPYLKRRHGQETQEILHPEIEAVLGRTYGVPIFQEQAMQLAVVAAGFSPGEADELRRAMGAWRRAGAVAALRDKLLQGMVARGYTPEFAARLYRQIEGFGDYGFPESHAASFALLVYASAWCKCHHPDLFLCALLNSQPMGFYAPAQLIQDARRHGVEVLAVDVSVSTWESQPEAVGRVRLGLHQVAGLTRTAAERIVAARAGAPFAHLADLAQRAELTRQDLANLATADALVQLAGVRRAAVWAAAQARPRAQHQGDLFAGQALDTPVVLPPASQAQDIVADYASLGFSLRRHPLSLLRSQLAERRFISAVQMAQLGDRALVRLAGIVTHRQRPGTASGMVFISLEDESGSVNVMVPGALVERFRREVLVSRLLGVFGQLQRQGPVQHLLARRLVDLSPWLGRLPTQSRDFH